MEKKYIFAFDEGTTGTRSIIYDKAGNEVASAYQEFSQIYPQLGWVEHDPMEIYLAQLSTSKRAIDQLGISPHEIAAIGITNQRETTVVWDKATGKPVYNAIVWQDRRTVPLCEELSARGLGGYINQNTGLLIDAYFSATKIRWILDNVEGVRQKAQDGEVLFGTIDSWLIWNLTGGKAHVIDYSNASRTLLFNIRTLQWDDYLLKELDIPRTMLPEVRPSSEVYATTDACIYKGAKIPVAASIGDQQSALFGQTCFEPGAIKATYGTGGSLMMNTGDKLVHSSSGLLTTIAWGIDGKVSYALEGLLYVVGSAVQWLRDELRMVDHASDTAFHANKVENTNGVYFVPAFNGLSAPYWDQNARGAIVGLTRSVTRNHIIRAVLESMAYQIRDVIECMESDSGIKNRELKVDGGACKNDFMLQFQSDILNIPVFRPKVVETTARGAAYLAGLATGFWGSKTELKNTFELEREFIPHISHEKRAELYSNWKSAVRQIIKQKD